MSAPAADTVNAPLPDDVTLPARPTPPTSCAVHGGGSAEDVFVTATLSNVAVVNMPLLWLVTATPTVALLPRTRDVMPIRVHDVPSPDRSPAKVDPLRVSRNHTGQVWMPPATNVVDAPATGRVMNSISP